MANRRRPSDEFEAGQQWPLFDYQSFAMSLSLYDVSVPVFDPRTRATGLTCSTRDWRMRSRPASIRRCCSMRAWHPTCSRSPARCRAPATRAKLGTARIAGITAPSYPDTEASYEELQARVAQDDRVHPPAWIAWPDRRRRRPSGRDEGAGATSCSSPPQRYLLQFALPNFFFHVTTAYGVLRQQRRAGGQARLSRRLLSTAAVGARAPGTTFKLS